MDAKRPMSTCAVRNGLSAPGRRRPVRSGRRSFRHGRRTTLLPLMVRSTGAARASVILPAAAALPHTPSTFDPMRILVTTFPSFARARAGPHWSDGGNEKAAAPGRRRAPPRNAGPWEEGRAAFGVRQGPGRRRGRCRQRPDRGEEGSVASGCRRWGGYVRVAATPEGGGRGRRVSP